MSGCPPEVDIPGWPPGINRAVAGLVGAARPDGMADATTALASLAATRRLAAGLERGELALIEAARSGGATWSQISAALGTCNRQTTQKRHADLARRCPRPPSVDIPEAQPGPGQPTSGPGTRRPEAIPPAGEDAPASARQLPGQLQFPLAPTAGPGPAAPFPPPGSPVTSPGRRRPAVPKVTDEDIAGSLYKLVKAPDYAETRAWLVLVGGRAAGLVRPTRRGERGRPGWEPVDLSGLALPVKGTGKVTPAGNARTRDAAAVSLLRALQRQQQEDKKQHATRRAARPPRTETA